MDEEYRKRKDEPGSAVGDQGSDRSILLTERVTPRLIQYICEQIVRLVSPQKIILFGSQARGDSQEGSDVDLLVIVNSPEDRRTATDRIHRFFMRRLFEMDVFVRTVEDVERNVLDHNPFYIHHILSQGKVLYERREAVPRP